MTTDHSNEIREILTRLEKPVHTSGTALENLAGHVQRLADLERLVVLLLEVESGGALADSYCRSWIRQRGDFACKASNKAREVTRLRRRAG